MVRDGDIGEVRMVNVEYVQGHNAALTEGEQGGEPANWHFVPEKVGPSLILGDIGSHAHHMARFVTGQRLRPRHGRRRRRRCPAAATPMTTPTSSSASTTARPA